MLHTLTLKNFALVKAQELSLTGGFSVITGETGAGKSLILDALSLCMGGRGGGDMVRFGEKTADIYAQFDTDHPKVTAWFFDNDRDFLDGEIAIRRQLSEQGRSKAWINGEPASLNELKSLGALLVNIHSQHAGLELLKPQFVITWLDEVGGLKTKAQAVKDAYHKWHTLNTARINALDEDSKKEAAIELLTSKIADIEPLVGINMAEIESQYDELSNIEELIHTASECAHFLDNDTDEPSVSDLLARAMKLCDSQSGLSRDFELASESLFAAYELIQDAHSTLTHYAKNQTADDETLQRLDSLIGLAHRLAKKYRTPIQELIAQAPIWQQQLDDLQARPDSQTLQADTALAYEEYVVCAKALHTARLDVAPRLCQTLKDNLTSLALPNASFEFDFIDRPTPSATGLHNVELLFSANTGIPKQPLHKVASGGELSRIALIMQVMAAGKADSLPLLVFDEVDVGISGGTAQIVGELLAKLGQSQQIIAITHQAQVAVSAHTHILVKKDQNDTKGTQSTLCILDDSERVYELARMSGGVNITDETLAHAQSLLDSIHPQSIQDTP